MTEKVKAESEVDEMEIGRCSCGLVFYSFDYMMNHVCLGHPDADDPWYGDDAPDGAM